MGSKKARLDRFIIVQHRISSAQNQHFANLYEPDAKMSYFTLIKGNSWHLIFNKRSVLKNILSSIILFFRGGPFISLKKQVE